MAYTTSSATNLAGLLDAVRAFALSNGWTIDTHEAITDGMWLHLHLGTAHFDLYTDDTPVSSAYSPGLSIKGATGYDGLQDQLNQPGARTDTAVVVTNDLTGGPFVAHHFFAGADFVHCVVEVSSGRFAHFGFGTLEKAGTYTGGEYMYGTRWYLESTTITPDPAAGGHYYPFASSGAQVRFTENDLDGTDKYKDWAVFSTNPLSATTYLRAVGWQPQSVNYNQDLVTQSEALQPNYFNGLSVLLPVPIICGRTNNLTSVLGAPKEFRVINIQNLSASQTLTLGTDTWLVFPVKQKGPGKDGTTTPYSGFHGIAYKKVV